MNRSMSYAGHSLSAAAAQENGNDTNGGSGHDERPMHRSASQNGSAMNLLKNSQNGNSTNGSSSPNGDSAYESSEYCESRFRPKTPLSAVFAEHLSLRYVT